MIKLTIYKSGIFGLCPESGEALLVTNQTPESLFTQLAESGHYWEVELTNDEEDDVAYLWKRQSILHLILLAEYDGLPIFLQRKEIAVEDAESAIDAFEEFYDSLPFFHSYTTSDGLHLIAKQVMKPSDGKWQRDIAISPYSDSGPRKGDILSQYERIRYSQPEYRLTPKMRQQKAKDRRTELAESDASPPIKRGRGRPRKHPVLVPA